MDTINKKYWEEPSVHKLELIKTLGGDLSDDESDFTQPDGIDGGSTA